MRVPPAPLTFCPNSAELCPFCDQLWPDHPSHDLCRRSDEVKKRATRHPNAKNPNHHDAPLSLTIDICVLHQAERDTIPAGLARGWPSSVNWDDLPSRIIRHFGALRVMVSQPRGCRLYDALITKIEKGLKIRSLAGRMILGNDAGTG